mmetsp:Transcript_8807/g.23297  ORF Transcript_8807/g.23297 Transcript_8807/m.23297 type:complete len:201 (+) Transcript_8807:412-1014(+)
MPRERVGSPQVIIVSHTLAAALLVIEHDRFSPDWNDSNPRSFAVGVEARGICRCLGVEDVARCFRRVEPNMAPPRLLSHLVNPPVGAMRWSDLEKAAHDRCIARGCREDSVSTMPRRAEVHENRRNAAWPPNLLVVQVEGPPSGCHRPMALRRCGHAWPCMHVWTCVDPGFAPLPSPSSHPRRDVLAARQGCRCAARLMR